MADLCRPGLGWEAYQTRLAHQCPARWRCESPLGTADLGHRGNPQRDPALALPPACTRALLLPLGPFTQGRPGLREFT